MKIAILSALRKFVNSRSGIDPRNYYSSYSDAAGREAFMEDYRDILRAGRDARRMIDDIWDRDDISAGDIMSAADRAYSGRLEIDIDPESGKVSVHYCAGQYHAVEYRCAVASVVANAIWRGLRDHYETGDDIRKALRRIFGRGIVQRYF